MAIPKCLIDIHVHVSMEWRGISSYTPVELDNFEKLMSNFSPRHKDLKIRSPVLPKWARKRYILLRKWCI